MSDNNNKVDKVKSKNIVMLDFLTKFKLLIKLRSGAYFLIFRARLAFAKLKQIFIKILIFYYFDLKCDIYIKIYILFYIIFRVFSQLVLSNLN